MVFLYLVDGTIIAASYKLQGLLWVSAVCECGYRVGDLFLGRGEAVEADWHPAFCSEGQHVVAVNRAGEPLACPKPRHISTPILYGLDRRLSPVESGELGGRHLCPRCRTVRLSFEMSALWD